MWHIGRSGEMQVGLQWFGLTGRQFGRSKKKMEK